MPTGQFVGTNDTPTRPCQPSFATSGLETEPGKILARTLIKYGAYVVDSGDRGGSGWCGIATELSPDGNYKDVWEAEWSDFFEGDASNPWGRDVIAIFGSLFVVDNSDETTTGGGDAVPAAWAIGPVELAFEDAPFDGAMSGSGRMRWAEHNPIGFSGTILQYTGTDAPDHRIHLRVSEDSYQALKAVSDLHQAVTVTAPRPRFQDGLSMVITEFTAAWNRDVPGDTSTPGYWWDIWIGLREV